jgi:hypothetical protein
VDTKEDEETKATKKDVKMGKRESPKT